MLLNCCTIREVAWHNKMPLISCHYKAKQLSCLKILINLIITMLYNSIPLLSCDLVEQCWTWPGQRRNRTGRRSNSRVLSDPIWDVFSSDLKPQWLVQVGVTRMVSVTRMAGCDGARGREMCRWGLCAGSFKVSSVLPSPSHSKDISLVTSDKQMY